MIDILRVCNRLSVLEVHCWLLIAAERITSFEVVFQFQVLLRQAVCRRARFPELEAFQEAERKDKEEVDVQHHSEEDVRDFLPGARLSFLMPVEVVVWTLQDIGNL